MDVSVVIPTMNEEATISEVIKDFKTNFPGAGIYVIDGNSTDHTAELAKKAGAKVIMQKGIGKGMAIKQAFKEIPADVYLLVDGDGTYAASDGKALIEAVTKGEAEMVVGSRINEKMEGGAMTTFNRIGNEVFKFFIMLFSQKRIDDPLSGYRAIDGEVARNTYIGSKSFEIEMELTMSFLNKDYRIKEIPIRYCKRKHNSISKLNPVNDGIFIMKTLLLLLRLYNPFFFFAVISFILFVTGLYLGVTIVEEFLATGYILRIPTLILSTLLILISIQIFSVGLILDFIGSKLEEIRFRDREGL
jgi:dolichol-phosphate mannosyltransferase